MTTKIDFLPADIHDVYAIKAWAEGTADEHQMKRAFKCIVYEVCGTYEMSFDPGSQRATDFNEGKRHIGRCLVGLVNLPSEAVQKGYASLQKKAAAIATVTKKGRSHGP